MSDDVYPLAGGQLSESQVELLKRLDRGGGRLTLKARELTTTDIAALTHHTQREYAVIRTAEKQRQLLELGRMGGSLPEETIRLIIHSHPGGRNAIIFGVSDHDVSALQNLGQRRSLIVNSEGTVAVVGTDGKPTVLKEYRFGSWRYYLRQS